MKNFFLPALLIVLGSGVGYYLGRSPAAAHDSHDHAAGPATAAVYQCPMHPWIKSDQPGAKCTICGMALVAVASTGGTTQDADPSLVTLTSAQAAVTGVKTSAVRRGPLERTLRVNGVIDDDETRHRILTARVPGRVEKLHVNFVGAEVRAGEPLAVIYSPEMLSAQRIYVERLRAGESAFSLSEQLAAREQLLELGLTEEEVRTLEDTRQPTAMVNIRAPMSGTVVAREVYEGQEINKDGKDGGTRLFEIGDFSRMWFMFDAYESDLAWLRVGQTVEVTVPSLPGETLVAPIDFIDPNLDPATRTARVRVVVENTGRRLLHRQTAQAVVRLDSPDALLVPRTAVLQHSGRPVVFVDRGNHDYAAREIQLGRRGDTDFEALSGLAEGDRVVTEGALILDGQAQLAMPAAMPMTPTGAMPDMPAMTKASSSPTDADALTPLALALAEASAALAADDLEAYRRALPGMVAAVHRSGAAHEALMPLADKLVDGPDLRTARRAFEPFATAVADLVRTAGLHRQGVVRIFQCPMSPVLGTGRWVQTTGELRNPFFGSAMLTCGEEIR